MEMTCDQNAVYVRAMVRPMVSRRGLNTSVMDHLDSSSIAFEKMVGCMDEAQVHYATSEL